MMMPKIKVGWRDDERVLSHLRGCRRKVVIGFLWVLGLGSGFGGDGGYREMSFSVSLEFMIWGKNRGRKSLVG